MSQEAYYESNPLPSIWNSPRVLDIRVYRIGSRRERCGSSTRQTTGIRIATAPLCLTCL
jgi:hypothetical protein